MTANINAASSRRTLLVTGAQGVSGRAVVEHYSKLPQTMVYGLSRRELAGEGNVKHISVDLLNADDIQAKLSPIQGITHLFFGAYIDKQDAARKSAINVQLLKGLLDYLGANVPTLRHVTIFQGGKAYGSDLGPYKTPAREDDPRLMSPNYYYDQEDLLRAQQKVSKWGFTVIRPGGAICGFSVGSAMNLILVIGVYAAICREMGLPLRFPGPQKVYDALYQVTSADILAEATIWAGETTPQKTKSSTSPTETRFAGSTCGRASERCLTWKSPSRCHSCSQRIWQTRRPSGTRSSRSTVCDRYPMNNSFL